MNAHDLDIAQLIAAYSAVPNDYTSSSVKRRQRPGSVCLLQPLLGSLCRWVKR